MNDTLDDVLAELEQAANFKRFNRIKFFRPYPKQLEFLNLGATKRERMLSAGNQQGKTEIGAYEMALHLTGDYPADWAGRRWDRPIRAWAVGESSVVTRDVQQSKLLGPPGVDADRGTGMIPRDAILDVSLSRGVTDAFDTVQVRHKSGGVSTLTFKSYEQGRTKFQGEPIDLVWPDEEPPIDIYMEMLTRTNATAGMVMVTFTPLKGKTEVAMRFFDEKAPDRALVIMTIYDALHITPEARAGIIASYRPHERDARISGQPMLGSGRIFDLSDESVWEDPIEFVPQHWWKLWSVDFGQSEGHKFGAILNLHDRDSDVIHIHRAFRSAERLPIMHASPMKQMAGRVPVAWPHDGNRSERGGTGDAKTTADMYKKEGLVMLPTHTTFTDGGYSTEAGVLEMEQRFRTGRLKVNRTLSDWFEEFRAYHRKEGIINKTRDDLMSATRIGVMGIRHAKQVPLGPIGPGGFKRRGGPDQNQWDVFSGT